MTYHSTGTTSGTITKESDWEAKYIQLIYFFFKPGPVISHTVL